MLRRWALRWVARFIARALAGEVSHARVMGLARHGLTALGGVLAAELSEVALYGGKVAGRAGLDGSGEALAADVALSVDRVDVGALAAAATPGEAPVAGVASGSLEARSQGASVRALVEAPWLQHSNSFLDLHPAPYVPFPEAHPASHFYRSFCYRWHP